MNILQSPISPSSHFSAYQPSGRIGKIFHFPLMRVWLILIFFAPVVIINSVIVFQVIEKLPDPADDYVNIIRMLITIPLFLWAYHFYCRTIEKRSAVEVSTKNGFAEYALGASVGLVMVCVMVGLIELFGDFEVLEYRAPIDLLGNFLLFSLGALMQDVVLMLVLFRLCEEWLGTWLAMFVSLSIFGGVHGFNENENLVSVLMLVLSSLIILTPFILTRRIWMGWGFHSLWNFAQAGIFGMPNSGIQFDGWIISKVTGPEWVTGGAVGLEATPLSFVLDVCIGILLLVIASKTGKIVQKKRAGQLLVDQPAG